MTSSEDLRTLSAVYSIKVPEPSAGKSIKIEIEFNRTWSTANRLELALASSAAPEITSTFEYYGIREDSVQAQIGGKPVPLRFPQMQLGDHYQRIEIDLSHDSPHGPVVVCYELDARRSDYLEARAIGQTYKDRVVVNSEYATLRGDTLLFPVTGPIESDGNGPGLPMNVQFRVSLPADWRLEINADTRAEKDTTVWGYEFDGRFVLRGFRWFALAGDLIVKTIEGCVKHVLVTSQWEVTPGGLEPEDAFRIAKDTISYYDRVFGMSMLEYLHEQPALGAKRGHQYVFLVPYPPKALRGAGGQHVPGSGMVYIFFSRHDLQWISHTTAHEYFHIYNDSALRTSRDLNGWFVEGYTEGQATLLDLQNVEAPQHRKNLYKLEMATQWALMQDVEQEAIQGLRSKGLLVPPSGRVRPADAPLAFASGRDLRDWSRLIRGRSFLLMHVIALIFESARPHRAGFNEWFRMLFKRIGWDQPPRHGGQKSPQGPPQRPSYFDFRQAALETAGPAAPMLDAFLSRFIERAEAFTLQDLEYWIRWAEEEKLFDTLLCKRSE